MKWSWKIGEFAGIQVYIHATFLLLLGWLAVSDLLQGATLLAVLSSIGYILALFACAPLLLIVVGIPLMIAIGLLMTVNPIIAGVRANDGITYRYPLTIRFLK